MKHDGKTNPDLHVSADSRASGRPADPAGAADGPEPVWHTLPTDEVAQALRTDPTTGLTDAEAARRLARYGPNALAAAEGRSAVAILAGQFKSLIVALLVGVSVVAFALGENLEAVAVLVVIALNTGVGFLTEWRAEQALTALQRQAVPTAHVVRGGAEREIPAADLVPGDLVVLSAGARVPADGRVVEGARLQVDEAVLTGESQAVFKTPEPIPDPDAALGDRRNTAFLGTVVTDGRGLLLVTATGARTEMGKIGRLIAEAVARDTPLERKLTQLGHALVALVLALCAVVVLLGWLRGATDFGHMLEVGISLAIAAVPEGLPAVTTMTLALGVLRMGRLRALIRRLPAVETLGSTTVICTDKTGTLTRNEMTVRVLVLDRRHVEVTGSGYAPAGEFRAGGRPVAAGADPHLALALRVGALCNDAHIEHAPGRDAVLGDPTEAALLVAAEKAGLMPAALERDYPRLAEVPFSSETKRMVTVHRAPEGKAVAFVKGSPGALLEKSASQVRAGGVAPLTAEDRRGWEEANRELAGGALRMLGLAYRELPEGYGEGDLTRDLVFVGLVGMMDPLRDEVKAAVATCRGAGVRVVMITGDQPATAAAIARELGIDRDAGGRPLTTVHGRDLGGLDEAGWQRVVSDTAVFARVSPEHKLRIVEALQRRGEVVAMTGDGVNDAPALKKADIGIAMGIKGTAVAKEASDMVITDDNFATIVGAVEQGRIIYANIVKFIHFAFCCNVSQIQVIFVAILLGWPLPLAALPILWLNMITNVFPAFALALEASARDVMTRPPRDPRRPLVDRPFVWLITWQGFLLAGVTLLAFSVGMRWYGAEGSGLRHATTLAFMTLAVAQVFHAFNARSQVRSAFTAQLFTNAWLWAAVAGSLLLQVAAVYVPFLQAVLHTVPLAAADWGVVLACALAPIGVVELVKLARRGVGPPK